MTGEENQQADPNELDDLWLEKAKLVANNLLDSDIKGGLGSLTKRYLQFILTESALLRALKGGVTHIEKSRQILIDLYNAEVDKSQPISEQILDELIRTSISPIATTVLINLLTELSKATKRMDNELDTLLAGDGSVERSEHYFSKEIWKITDSVTEFEKLTRKYLVKVLTNDMLRVALELTKHPKAIAEDILLDLEENGHIETVDNIVVLWEWIRNTVKDAPAKQNKFVQGLEVAFDFQASGKTQIVYAELNGMSRDTLSKYVAWLDAIRTLASLK